MALSQGPVSTTASTCTAETARGRHTFVVAGYSLHRGLGAGKFIRSATFHVGGHGWSVRCYPDGHTGKDSNQDFVCVYIELMAAKQGAACNTPNTPRICPDTLDLSGLIYSCALLSPSFPSPSCSN